MTESQTLAISKKGRELKAQGIDVISLGLGESDFNTPQFIKDAAIEAINKNYSHYPPVPGYMELRETISKKFKRDNNLNYKPGQIVVSTGAKQTLANVILCLINPGDEVLLPTPYWVSYSAIVKLAEGIPVTIRAGIKTDFKVTPDQIKAAINEKTKVLLFSSPCNPSGTVYTGAELKAIAEVIAQYPDIYIISDEIYEHIIFDGKHESIAAFDFIRDKVITVNGLSKGFAMTGWRLGYMGAPEWIAGACEKLQGQITSGTCTISQMAAITALRAEPSSALEMRDAFKKRRDRFLELLKEVPGFRTNIPQGAFYIFPEVSSYFGRELPQGISLEGESKTKIINANDLCLYLLNEANVATVPGDAFGEPDHIRFSFVVSEEKLAEAVERIKKALRKLR